MTSSSNNVQLPEKGGVARAGSTANEAPLVSGSPVPRIDGLAKVTGKATYGDDHRLAHAAHARLVMSTIARGSIRSIDYTAARAVPGVLDILTYENIGTEVKPGAPVMSGGYTSSRLQPLASPKIHFGGQIVAVVIAETPNAAEEAAVALNIVYDQQPATAGMNDAGAISKRACSLLLETKLKVGDAHAAYERAAFRVDATYETAPQHHNPMELFQVICAWDGDTLMVWESTQHVIGTQRGIAKQLGIKPSKVRVISPFVGGGFGARNMPPSTPLIAFAARKLRRPVRLVVSRRQGFSLMTFRAETRHRVRLAADLEGRFQSLSHDSWELNNRIDSFVICGSANTSRQYAFPNIRTQVNSVTADRQPPGFMRAPPEVPYMFALESAIDELAHAMSIDPIELRRRNDTLVEPVKKLPFSSRSMMRCFDIGAEAFGWAKRDLAPRSMRDGDYLVGWGCAAASYPAQLAAADCRVTLSPDDRALVEIGTHEIGTGAYTVLAQTAALALGLPLDRVEVRLGDSSLPASPMAAGSISTASNCNAVNEACRKIAKRRGGRSMTSPIVERYTFKPKGALPFSQLLIRRGIAAFAGPLRNKHAQFSSGAHFVEVHIHAETGQIRVPRIVGAFAAGTIINPITARSQLMGGQIWGLSGALYEATEIDRRTARHVNDSFAEYLIPVNADIGSVETILVPEKDEIVNPLGIKGVGELGNPGMNAAVANAVFHATGKRCRSLPIRLEHLV